MKDLIALGLRLFARARRALAGPREAKTFAACLDRALVDAPAALRLRTLERALSPAPDEPAAASTDLTAGL